MQRFHFHVIDGDDIRDEEGVELPDLAAARHCAIRLAADSLRDQTDRYWIARRWAMEVRDAEGAGLFTLTLVAADAPS